MHPARRRIALRWFLGLAPLLAAGGWLFFEVWAPLGSFGEPETTRAAQRTAPAAAAYVPSLAQQEQLAKALLAVERMRAAGREAEQNRAAPDMALVAPVNPATPLAALQGQAAPTAPKDAAATPRLSLIFFSAKERLAVIDNGIYAQSGRLPDGRVVERIDRDGVVLSGGGRRERLVWTPPARVELRRQAPERTAPSAPTEDQNARAWLPDNPLLYLPNARRELFNYESRGRRHGAYYDEY
jgi:hypothetical protein